MANKEALRQLQDRLADRLQTAQAQPRGASWLAVECAERGLLLPLAEAGEIFALPDLARVAHARPWFLGVANLRGGLYGAVDLAAFLGFERPQRWRDEARLVAFSAALDLNCALLVDRLCGLRGAEQLTQDDDDAAAAPAGPQPAAFIGRRFRDQAGQRWQELHLAALARDDAFLTIVA